jgi:hypothetical protein
VSMLRTEGPTPAGGAYAVAIIDDSTGDVLEITEHAECGAVLARHYGAGRKRSAHRHPSNYPGSACDGSANRLR